MILLKTLKLEHLKSNFDYSNEFTNDLKNIFNNFSNTYDNHLCIGVVGSFARCEASESSDFDYFILFSEDNNDNIDEIKTKFEEEFNKKFKNIKISLIHSCKVSDLLKNIGGSDDTSKSLTMRVLLLLESKCLFNEKLYSEVINVLHEKYLEEYIRERKFPLFFVNEIIRYWRTLCIDYRYKKIEANKPWGLRNIKLRFSRKFDTFLALYFSILLYKNKLNLEDFKKIIKSPTYEKIEKINQILSISTPFLNKFAEICSIYDKFIGYINEKNNRNQLENLKFEERNQNPEYIRLKGTAEKFHDKIIEFLKSEDENLFNKYIVI